jgi:signal transduction histidine kinase
MFRALIFGVLSAAMVACAVENAFAQKAQFGTPAEAKAMEERVIAELKANGNAAFEKLNKPDGEFREGYLYVFCFNAKSGIFTAHANPALLGTDIRLIVEKDGSPLGQKIFNAANATTDSNIVTVSYNFPKPGTANPVPKESYVTRVGDQACGVGYYK